MSLRIGPITGLRIGGTATALPSEVGVGTAMSNADLYHRLLGADADAVLADRGWSTDHPLEAWGVARREWMRDRVPGSTSDADDVVELAATAVERALGDAGLAPGDVDLVVGATSTPPRISSTLAAYIGKRLSINAPCIDMRAGGAGGLSAWVTAARFVGPDCRTAVVVAVETPSRFVDRQDLATALLYGDAAAALVLQHDPSTDGGLLGAVLGRADAGGRPFTVPGDLPPTADQIDSGAYHFQRPDAEYRAALQDIWRDLCRDLRESFPAAADETADFLPYAVTTAQVRAAADDFGVPEALVVHALADQGCTGCSSPLVALDIARRRSASPGGRVVASVAAAGGVSTAGVLWRM